MDRRACRGQRRGPWAAGRLPLLAPVGFRRCRRCPVEGAQSFRCRTPEAVAEERFEREREVWAMKTRLR